MKVVLDTNVVIDAVAARQPFNEAAEAILRMASEGKITAYLTANSVTDIFYVVRRSLPEAKTREIIRSLLYSLDVIGVSGEECWEALTFQTEDFKDALVAVCAKKTNADFIISRDKAFLASGSSVPAIAPPDFLASIAIEGKSGT